jgi:hypothetical protein
MSRGIPFIDAGSDKIFWIKGYYYSCYRYQLDGGV